MKEQKEHGREINLEELKVLQMDVLQAIDEFCSEHNIRYSMACGTLLGAIRHKGYIPWDDDIDIYVPRNDYKRLISEFPDLYKNRYKLSSLERDSLWEKPYAKAYDNYTVVKENARMIEDIGVNIDVFPVDEVPDGDEWEYFDRKRRRRQELFSLKFVRVDFSKRSIIKNLFLLLIRLSTFWLSKRTWAKKLDRYCQKFNGKGYNYYFECCQGLFQKRPFKKSIFNELVYIPFEDRQFKAFADADNYLHNGFGDYMQLPPVEQRIVHHSFKAYWK